MMSFLHPCATPWLSLMAGRCAIGETHRGQQGTPALTLPHRRDGLRVLLMAVWCPFRRPSLCRPVHRPFMRNALLNLLTIVPATPCHHRNDVEAYSRYNFLLLNHFHRVRLPTPQAISLRGSNGKARGTYAPCGHGNHSILHCEPGMYTCA
jgi:hypothetical protein